MTKKYNNETAWSAEAFDKVCDFYNQHIGNCILHDDGVEFGEDDDEFCEFDEAKEILLRDLTAHADFGMYTTDELNALLSDLNIKADTSVSEILEKYAYYDNEELYQMAANSLLSENEIRILTDHNRLY